MYVIYVSQNINVTALAEIWGQQHNTVHNGVLQSIHLMLKQHPDWANTIRFEGKMPRNARVIHLDNAVHEDLVAIEFTGLMQDPAFQVIASIEDERVNDTYNIFKLAQNIHANKTLGILQDDASDQIESHGVYDRTSMQSGKIQFTLGNSASTNAMRKHLDTKKTFITEYVTEHYTELGSCLKFLITEPQE